MPTRSPRETLLIVDDELLVRRVMTRALAKPGRRIVGVSSGEAALAACRRVRPDLIVADVMMPGMDGVDLCRRLREQQSTRSVPILIVTCLASPQIEGEGLARRADACLAKPFQTKELAARVEALLEKAREGPRP